MWIDSTYNNSNRWSMLVFPYNIWKYKKSKMTTPMVSENLLWPRPFCRKILSSPPATKLDSPGFTQHATRSNIDLLNVKFCPFCEHFEIWSGNHRPKSTDWQGLKWSKLLAKPFRRQISIFMFVYWQDLCCDNLVLIDVISIDYVGLNTELMVCNLLLQSIMVWAGTMVYRYFLKIFFI